MGLFSFLKNAGSKIFNTKPVPTPRSTAANARLADETAEDNARRAADVARKQKIIVLKGVINSLGLDVEDLEVDFYEDTVTVYGKVDSQSEKEKVILSLGNVAGVAAVDDRMIVDKPAAEATFYEVRKGDSLSKIAKRQYGNAMKYPVIFEANKPMLKDPSKIYPGQMLRIPPLDA